MQSRYEDKKLQGSSLPIKEKMMSRHVDQNFKLFNGNLSVEDIGNSFK